MTQLLLAKRSGSAVAALSLLAVLAFLAGLSGFAVPATAKEPYTPRLANDIISGQAAIFDKHLRREGRTVYRVGPTQDLKLPSEAAKIATDGAVVEIEAGVYPKDAAVWKQNDLIITGVGGRAHLAADGANAGGKAIWVITGNDVTVENIEFSGAKVRDRNGAGIRQEGRNLTVRDSYFHDNENGILAANSPDSVMLIERSEFARNGHGKGQTHNIYINNIGRLIVRDSYFHHAKIGHNVKSRAAETYVLTSLLADAADGRSSRLIDVPNGGRVFVIGNVLQQGKRTDNSNLIGFGVEGRLHQDSVLHVVNNTLVSDREWAVFVDNRANGPAYLVNNIFDGAGNILVGPGRVRNNLIVGDYGAGAVVMHLAKEIKQSLRDPGRLLSVPGQIWDLSFKTAAGFVDRQGYDFKLADGSAAIDGGVDVVTEDGILLLPAFEYEHPLKRVPRKVVGAIDLGAFERH